MIIRKRNYHNHKSNLTNDWLKWKKKKNEDHDDVDMEEKLNLL